MKKVIAFLTIALVFTFTSQAQMDHTQVKTITLEQVKGEFVQKEIKVDPGTYKFSIFNNDVGHDVGFVLVPVGKDISNPENHIKTAYVTESVSTGKTQSTQATTLAAGSYYYFCPLNPTATDNLLIVE
ncbi:MAG: cupredoxin domain-containing protein [Nonlabens sp.]|uniref:cupredoxin domain-containing protein n=1 Tax=Nonlabens sp. TaxID=1888209 RepID=UPI003EF5B7CC